MFELILQVPIDADFFDVSLNNLEAKCVRSLNGYRSTQELLRLVPNGETFRVRERELGIGVGKGS